MKFRIDIQENFLEKNHLEEITQFILSEQFPWYVSGVTGMYDSKKHFFHSFYNNNNINSPYFDLIKNIITKLNPITLHRVKLNLIPKSNSIIEHDYHKDNQSLNLTSSLFYINTNNGYTKFENGKKINSTANKIVSFPSNVLHHGTTCTDKEFRIALNMVYVK